MNWISIILSFLHFGAHSGMATRFSEQEGNAAPRWSCGSKAMREGRSHLSSILGQMGHVFASRNGECWSVRLIWVRGHLALATRGDYGPGNPARELDLLDPLGELLTHNGLEVASWIEVVP